MPQQLLRFSDSGIKKMTQPAKAGDVLSDLVAKKTPR